MPQCIIFRELFYYNTFTCM